MIRVASATSMSASQSQSQSQSQSMEQSQSPPSSVNSSISHPAGSSTKHLQHRQLVVRPGKRVRSETMRASGSGSISLSSNRVPSGRGGSAATIAPSNYLVTVIPPDTFPTEHSRVSAACSGYGGPPSKFRRGTLIPLYPTLSSQCAAIAREYGLPSAGGLVLYLVDLTSTHDTGRYGTSYSPTHLSPQSRSGKDGLAASLIGGPKISEQAWHILWNRLFQYQQELQVHEHRLVDGGGSNGEIDDSEDSGSDDARFHGRPPSSPMSSHVNSPEIRKAHNHSRTDSRVTSPSGTRSTASPARQTSAQFGRYDDDSRTELQSSVIANALQPSMASLSSPRAFSVVRSRKSSDTKTRRSTRQRSFAGDSFNQSVTPPYGQTVVVGKLEFDIDQRKGAKWYESWLAGAHTPSTGDDTALHSRDTLRQQRVASVSTTGQSLLGTGRLHFERSILNEPELSLSFDDRGAAEQANSQILQAELLPVSLKNNLTSSSQSDHATAQETSDHVDDRVQLPSLPSIADTPSRSDRVLASTQTPTSASGEVSSRLSPVEARRKRPSLTARSASSASVASLIHGFEIQQNDVQRKSPTAASSRSGSVTPLAKEFEAKQQAQSPLNGSSPTASPVVIRTRKTSASAISPLRHHTTASMGRSNASEASGYSDDGPLLQAENQYSQLPDDEHAGDAQGPDATIPNSHPHPQLSSKSNEAMRTTEKSLSATSDDPLQDMFMTDERNWAMMRSAESDIEEAHSSEMPSSQDAERIESAQSASFPADTLSIRSKLPASASSTFDPFEFEEELTAVSATGDDVEDVKEMLQATSFAKSNGLSSPIMLNGFARIQHGEEEHSSDSDVAVASPRHIRHRSSTAKSRRVDEAELLIKVRSSQSPVQSASGVTINEPVDTDADSELPTMDFFARDPKVVARLKTEDVLRNRSSSIEMMNSLDEIERALQELSPRSNRTLNASPLMFGSLAETAQSLHYDRLPVVAQVQGYQRESSDEGTAPLTPPYAHRNVSEISLYATADEDARGGNGQDTALPTPSPHSSVDALRQHGQDSPKTVTSQHAAISAPARGAVGTGSPLEAESSQTRLVGLKIRGWPSRSSREGKDRSASGSNTSSSPRSPRTRDVDPQAKARLQDAVQSSLQSGIQKFKQWAGSSASSSAQPTQDLAQNTALPESPIIFSRDQPPRLPRKSSLHNAMVMVKPLPRSDSLSPNLNGQQFPFSQQNTPNLNYRLFSNSNAPSPPTHTSLPFPPAQRFTETQHATFATSSQYTSEPSSADRSDDGGFNSGNASSVPSWMIGSPPFGTPANERQSAMLHSPPARSLTEQSNSLRVDVRTHHETADSSIAPPLSPSSENTNAARGSVSSIKPLSPSPSPSRLSHNNAVLSPAKAARAGTTRSVSSKDLDLARLMSQMQDLDFADERLS